MTFLFMRRLVNKILRIAFKTNKINYMKWSVIILHSHFLVYYSVRVNFDFHSVQ